MKFLIVEDQEAKAQEIIELFAELDQKDVHVAASFVDAKRCLSTTTYDWVILDMTIPFEGSTHAGMEENFEALGGRLLLREMRFKKWLCKVVIVTQYPVFDPGGERISFSDLKREAETTFSDYFKGIVFFRRGSSVWRTQLKDLIFS